MPRFRSKLALNHVQKILNDAGYQTWACHRTRVQLIALLTIAVNQIAAASRRPVWRVYETLGVSLRYTLRGGHFRPKTVRTLWAGKRLEGEKAMTADGRCSRCPCCGRMLPEDLPPVEEIGRNVERET